MQVEILPIDGIRLYVGNPRVNDHAVDAVAASIREFGWRQPIVVDTEGVIVAGSTRWKAAKKLGLAEVPVHVARDLSADQARAYRLADNRLAEIADWNEELLAVELAGLRQGNLDLGLLGFDAAELEALLGAGIHGNAGLVDPDSIPAPPAAATTKLGDLWRLGEHRLLCGDSSKPEDLDRLLGGAAIQLVNTDPPYNVKVEPRSNRAIAAGFSTFGADGAAQQHHHQGMDVALHPEKAPSKGKGKAAALRPKDRPLANDFVSDAEFERLLRAWFGNIARVLEPGRTFYVWGGYANIANYPPALAGADLYFSQAIVWVKEHPVLTRKDFMGNHEWCFYGWREGAAHYFNSDLRNTPDVWRLSRATQGKVAIGRGVNLVAADGSRIGIGPPQDRFRGVEIGSDGVDCYSATPTTDVWTVKKVAPQAMVHLTEKPVELAERAMACSSRPGENVLDLFGGSGSTLIGAERTGRRAHLLELDPLYCDVIVQRFEQFTGKKAELLP